jgi:hypothetical protein
MVSTEITRSSARMMRASSSGLSPPEIKPRRFRSLGCDVRLSYLSIVCRVFIGTVHGPTLRLDRIHKIFSGFTCKS